MNTYKFTKHELQMLEDLSKKGVLIGKRYSNKMDYLRDLIFKLHFGHIIGFLTLAIINFLNYPNITSESFPTPEAETLRDVTFNHI